MVLRLLPLPKAKRTLLAIFSTIEGAATAVSQIISCRIIPTTLEFMDNAAIRCVEDYLHMGLPVEAGALLIIEVDGAPEAIAQDVLEIQNICLANRALEVKAAQDDKEAEDLWKARRAVSPAVVVQSQINEDITVPGLKSPKFHRPILLRKAQSIIVTLATR
jgi:glycolate oxidase